MSEDRKHWTRGSIGNTTVSATMSFLGAQARIVPMHYEKAPPWRDFHPLRFGEEGMSYQVYKGGSA